ncbi:MAG: hypothetical protein H6529_12160 [Nocardioides sp.]|nr:hypothetical protein [Nocardioidaceae bacterium]MCB8957218.1 hypothetical protein [Nocardioides sp.]
MALLHRATLTPTKPELIAAWLPSQEWADGLPELRPLGGYRLDDPDGEVGMEGILLQGADDTGDTVVVHVPLTYRGAPLEGAEAHLLGTTEHSTLGTRWVYDATGDPVWRAALARTVAEGGAGAEEYFEVDGERVVREPAVRVVGSGRTEGEPIVVHVVGTADGDPALTGTWDGGTGVLAVHGRP